MSVYDSQGRYLGADTGYGGQGGFSQNVQGPQMVTGSSSDTLAAQTTEQNDMYTQIMAGYDKRIADAQYFGAQGYQDIAQQYQGINSGIQQNLLSRGLQNTTIAATMANGVQQQKDSATARYRNSLVDQELGLQKDRLDYMSGYQRNSGGGATGAFWGASQRAASQGGGAGGVGSSGGNFNPGTATGQAAGAGYTYGGISMPYRQPGTSDYTGYAGFAGTSGITPYKAPGALNPNGLYGGKRGLM